MPTCGDSVRDCAAALRRLQLILGSAGAAPKLVALLPDRSSQILGIAAAAVLGLPPADFDPARPAPHSLVIAYDLTQADPDAVVALRSASRARSLFERATCWTSPPPVTADISGLLAQVTVPPWAASCAASMTAASARARQTTAPPRLSPLKSPAPRPSQSSRATADVRGGRRVPVGSGRRTRKLWLIPETETPHSE